LNIFLYETLTWNFNSLVLWIEAVAEFPCVPEVERVESKRELVGDELRKADSFEFATAVGTLC
jgi:hypothetical protein